MVKNMGNVDRALRFVLAAAIAILWSGGIIHGLFGVVLAVFGAVLLLTSFVGFCPLYAVFHWSTEKHAGSH